jgi:hypothetical protein
MYEKSDIYEKRAANYLEDYRKEEVLNLRFGKRLMPRSKLKDKIKVGIADNCKLLKNKKVG